MSLRPSQLRRGDRVLVETILGLKTMRKAIFVKREPARGKGCPACNHLIFPEFAGLDGPDDDGLCMMSDYDLARQGSLGDES